MIINLHNLDMDVHIGDLHSLIVDREIEIVQALLEEILVHYDLMAEACDVFAELDCLLAFADAARMYDYHRPNMVEENITYIKQGRSDLLLGRPAASILMSRADILYRNRWWTLLFLMMHG